MATESEDGSYRIGTVAQLTGLSVDTIRAWERRYQTVRPRRTEGGTRLYSEADINRLQLVKALTDCGEAIGTVARLDEGALRERLRRHVEAESRPDLFEPGTSRETVGVSVLEPLLAEQLRANPAELMDLELVVTAADLDAFLAASRAAPADVVVLGLAQLGAQPEEALARCMEASRASAAVIVYDYAPRRRLARLADRGVRLVRGPVRVSLLRRSVLDFLARRRARAGRAEAPPPPELPSDERQPAPARLFSDRQLAQLREVRSALDCECPNHLSAIVTSLLAFERYSEQCMAEDPEDAATHEMLARGTGHARAAVERLLTRLCEKDGIRL